MVDRNRSVAEAVIIANRDSWAEDYYDLGSTSVSSQSSSTVSASELLGGRGGAAGGGAGGSSRRCFGSCMAGLSKYSSLIVAMLMCQVRSRIKHRV